MIIFILKDTRTPEKNESGYEDNSPINHVDKLIGKYLLIHGSADDNVHYQNSMEMIFSLLIKINNLICLFTRTEIMGYMEDKLDYTCIKK